MDDIKKVAIENRQDNLEEEVSEFGKKNDKIHEKILDHEIKLHDLDKRVTLSERDITDINKSMDEIKSDTRFIRQHLVKTMFGIAATVLGAIILIGLGAI